MDERTRALHLVKILEELWDALRIELEEVWKQEESEERTKRINEISYLRRRIVCDLEICNAKRA
jgi:hypothetical protein